MSHFSDSSSRTLNDLAPQSSTPQSAAALGSSEVGGALKKLKFNEHGLPIGENSTKSSSRLGYLSRTHIPVRYAAWPKVPKCYKDQLWNAYKAEYPDVKDCQRGLFMRKASGAWKKFKGKLRANLVGDDVTKWKEYVPNNVKSDDWEAYCDHEATLSQKEVRKRNKAIKNSSERKSTHNTGRNGYARSAEKWENENGRPPTRAELWLYTHKKKDGTYAHHDQEFAAKVEMLLKVHKGKCNEETLDSGPIYDIFGKDKGGSVRCVGSTVSRRSLLASAFAREMLKEVTEERDNWVEEVGTLKKEMDNVKSTLTEFISNFRSGKFATDDNDDNQSDNDSFKSGKFVTDDNDGNDNDNDNDNDDDGNGNDNDNDNGNDNMAISPTFATPTSDHQFSSLNDLTPYGVRSHVTEIPGYSGCEIRSHTNEIVGYGRKAKLGAVSSVHGRQLGTREVPVLLDKILVPNYLLWGGKQGHCNTLADVGVGGFMCWHDDYVPSLDDTLLCLIKKLENDSKHNYEKLEKETSDLVSWIVNGRYMDNPSPFRKAV